MKRVSFEDYSEVAFSENLTQEQKVERWYSRQEIEGFKLQTFQVLRVIKANSKALTQLVESKCSESSALVVGVERYLWPDRNEARLRRRAAIWAVLIEQRRQLNMGAYDPIAMANVSIRESAWFRMRAERIGSFHADE